MKEGREAKVLILCLGNLATSISRESWTSAGTTRMRKELQESDEVKVVMEHMKVCGAKNHSAFDISDIRNGYDDRTVVFHDVRHFSFIFF